MHATLSCDAGLLEMANPRFTYKRPHIFIISQAIGNARVAAVSRALVFLPLTRSCLSFDCNFRATHIWYTVQRMQNAHPRERVEERIKGTKSRFENRESGCAPSTVVGRFVRDGNKKKKKKRRRKNRSTLWYIIYMNLFRVHFHPVPFPFARPTRFIYAVPRLWRQNAVVKLCRERSRSGALFVLLRDCLARCIIRTSVSYATENSAKGTAGSRWHIFQNFAATTSQTINYSDRLYKYDRDNLPLYSYMCSRWPCIFSFCNFFSEVRTSCNVVILPRYRVKLANRDKKTHFIKKYKECFPDQ